MFCIFRWLFSTCSSEFGCFLHVFFVFCGKILLLNRPVAKVTGHRTHLNQIFDTEAAPGIFQVTAPWGRNHDEGKKPPLILDQTGHLFFWFHPGKTWICFQGFGKFHFGNSMFDTLLIWFCDGFLLKKLCRSEGANDRILQHVMYISRIFSSHTKASKITTNSQNSSRISQSSFESTKSFTLSRKGNRFNSPPQTPSRLISESGFIKPQKVLLERCQRMVFFVGQKKIWSWNISETEWINPSKTASNQNCSQQSRYRFH